ncbi:MAG: GtrA family protein [Ruthenibacterium lactatiformans]
MRLFKKLFSFFWDRSLLIFLIIGGLNTLVSMVGSQLLYGALGYWGATALMFTVCSVFSFIFNRKYSFESKALCCKAPCAFCGHRGVLPHQLRPFGFSGADVHGALLSAVSTDWQARIAMLVAQVIFTACNYLGQRLWALKNKPVPHPILKSLCPGHCVPGQRLLICNRRCRAGDGIACGLSRRAPFHHSRRGAPAALKAPARVSSSS